MPPEETTPRFNYRMDMGASAIVMLFAFIFDALSAIPFANIVIALIAPWIIGGIFWLNGIRIWERKFFWMFIMCSFIEFIPLLSILPMYSAEAWYIIFFSRVADRALMAATKATEKVIGKRAAALAVGVAYRGVATGEVPLQKPETLGQTYRGLTQALRTGALATVGIEGKKLETNQSAVPSALSKSVDGMRAMPSMPPRAANDNETVSERMAA